MASFNATLCLAIVAYIGLVCIQKFCPLDFKGPRRTVEVPIQPAAWAFGIWGVIFSLQLSAIIAAAIPAAAPWARPMFMQTAHLVIATWVTEASWTAISYARQQLQPTWEAPWYWAAATMLVAGHVLVSLALRAAVFELEALMRRGGPAGQFDARLLAAQGAYKGAGAVEMEAAALVSHDQGDSIGTGGVIGACALFVVPCALNAAWLGLASCLGILQICAAYGMTYASMVGPGLGLLVLAACTLGTQPWCPVPPLPAMLRTHLPHAVAHLGYKAVLAWGLFGIRGAGRPEQVHTLALGLLLALPIISAAGVAIKAWVAARAWGGHQAYTQAASQ